MPNLSENDCQLAFEKIKNILIKLPLLCYPDINLPYTLYTDASDKCVGACLTQTIKEQGQDTERPVYYLSHRLTDTQTRWSVIEKEAYSIFIVSKNSISIYTTLSSR